VRASDAEEALGREGLSAERRLPDLRQRLPLAQQHPLCISLDCSGLTQWTYLESQANIPRLAILKHALKGSTSRTQSLADLSGGAACRG
jgi:hypothetical protein